ncbi:Gag protease polyprotein [Gossypium australe]|uniref:Gag protease polyprotein n=1 Tax=Gossypium australe TaxID=47621 RepID=A0A5B6UTY1_9ROSI|nr:Gag protease polyprotein [Gossypium australe]
MIPKWKWDRVTMDFVSGLPLSPKKKDVIWVVVDKLTKSAHFILVRTDFSLDKLVELYIFEIVRLHGVPLSIVSDRDPRFTLRFWKKLQEALGSKLHFSTAFQPQMDGQSERFEGSWEKYLPLIEFAYNNSFQLSIKMAPYEALYSHLKWKDIEFQIGDKVFLKISSWKKISDWSEREIESAIHWTVEITE